MRDMLEDQKLSHKDNELVRSVAKNYSCACATLKSARVSIVPILSFRMPNPYNRQEFIVLVLEALRAW